MSRKLVECIPNFSEGRRPEVVAAIVEAIARIPSTRVLDRHSDEDHNRTVVTFVAPPERALQAAFAGVAKAAELIDMEQHTGEHPRIGAADVVPFVPLAGTTDEECVELARRLGKRIGGELGIPVYLYEHAALRPERTNLEHIRRGEYEGLREAIGTDPARAPDFGPARLGKAGATVVGARAPLIAYNVYLTTEDDAVAKRVARAVRYSSGGLRYVKSLGLLVEGRAQVSMNLTDFRRTPIARVVEMVRREAARYGVGVHHSELVGLAPQEALLEAARWYLQLDGFEAHQVLETRLFEAASEEGEGFLDALASADPTPGGGSAAAHVGAVAAALVAMVARLTVGKKKYADVEARMSEIAGQADELRARLTEAVERDAAAFSGFMEALRLPKESEAEAQAQSEALARATHAAAAVPLEVAEMALEVLELAVEVAERGNLNAASDAGSAGEMARAALRSAGLNVRVNAQSAADRTAAQSWLDELGALETRADETLTRLRELMETRAGLAAGG